MEGEGARAGARLVEEGVSKFAMVILVAAVAPSASFSFRGPFDGMDPLQRSLSEDNTM